MKNLRFKKIITSVQKFCIGSRVQKGSAHLKMKNSFWPFLVIMAVGRICFAQSPEPASLDSSVRPIPGPHAGMTFTGCSALPRGANRVILQWDADSAADGDYFVVERSPDEIHYEMIGVQQATSGVNHYEMIDGTAPNGLDYYRIKYTGRTGSPMYSKTMQLSLSGTVDFKFYPNPVDKLFIVRTEHTIDLQVLDAAGAVRVSKRLQPGIQVVDISFLGKGVYVLRVTDKESNRVVSQQLLKN